MNHIARLQVDPAQRALQPGWDEPVLVSPYRWELPAGAHGDSPGPT